MTFKLYESGLTTFIPFKVLSLLEYLKNGNRLSTAFDKKQLREVIYPVSF